jgi:signal transduction histidine kinase
VRKTIRYKLVLLVLTPLSIAVLLIAALSVWRDSTDAAELETARLRSTAQILASVVFDAAEAKDRSEAFAALRAIAQMEEISYARLQLTNGVVLAETGAGSRLTSDPALTGAGEGLSLRRLFSSSAIQVSVPIQRGSRQVGSVLILAETSSAMSRANNRLSLTLLGAALAGLAGMAVAYRMQASISGPIVGLTQAMGEVRQSGSFHLDSKLESDDEVGDLIDGFNDMLSEIRQRDLQLAGQLANLERQVSERTEDLLAAKNTAEAANASKSDFLATMSHEIRTPMNGIMVMAEMLATADMGHRQRRYAEVIAKSGRNLLSIINDILDFSKIEAGKMELEQVPMDLSDLVDDTTALFWERAKHKRIDLASFVDPALPRKVLGDPVRLRQVIGNLVNNAIKFTEEGGVLIRVEPAGGETVRVSIQDTGIGIPADKIDTLFAAFTQVDQSTTRRFGGTGLGLAISKRLIDAMGGRVAVNSVEGRGSTFSFEWAAPAAEPALPWPSLAGRPAALAALSASGLSTRFALARYLQLAGASLGAEQPGLCWASLRRSPRPAVRARRSAWRTSATPL